MRVVAIPNLLCEAGNPQVTGHDPSRLSMRPVAEANLKKG
jgi:hypothetical protein